MKRIPKSAVLILVFFILVAALPLAGCSNSGNNAANSGTAAGNGRFRSPTLNQDKIKTILTGLVKDGTINQKQADSVAEYLNKQAEARKQRVAQRRNDVSRPSNVNPPDMAQPPEQSQMPGQTPGNWGQRRNTGQRANMLVELVTNGTITQAQADKIMQAIFQSRNSQQQNNTSSNSI